MTREEYVAILRQHGRRVANRVAFAAVGIQTKTLDDFYAMYGAEDDLPESERCRTDMINMFDPTGWFVYYEESADNPLWPEPSHTEDQK